MIYNDNVCLYDFIYIDNLRLQNDLIKIKDQSR